MALILYIGSDQAVIDPRNDLFRQNGYEVWATPKGGDIQDALAAGSKPDVFVLCETLSLRKRIDLALKLQAHFPFKPRVVLLNVSEFDTVDGATKTVYAKDGSNVLLKAIAEVLQSQD